MKKRKKLSVKIKIMNNNCIINYMLTKKNTVKGVKKNKIK